MITSAWQQLAINFIVLGIYIGMFHFVVRRIIKARKAQHD